MKIFQVVLHLTWIAMLTISTQIGGLIWLLAVLISKNFRIKKRLVFPLLYLIFNLVVVPPIAKQLGRERLPIISKHVKPVNWFYPLAFRNYVKPELKNILIKSYRSTGIPITYLDANFPFADGFPLLPHLSHNDGKKIDLAFMYKTQNGELSDKKPSWTGYGNYVNSDINYTSKSCLEKGYWQYDFPKYFNLEINKNLKLDYRKTKSLITNLLSHTESQKLFIEPYLKSDLGLSSYSKIRYHGCQAVRHDDHIHFQIK